MYKKHSRDRKSKLELTVKALVAKALEEQGLSMETRIVMAPSEELALVGSPLDVPSSQGSTASTTPVDRIREPTSCTLVVLIAGRCNIPTMGQIAVGPLLGRCWANGPSSWYYSSMGTVYPGV
jgi:hypothetical protein